MDKMKTLISTLQPEDVQKVNEWITNYPDEVPKDQDKAVNVLIYNILWDYKSRAEDAPFTEAMKINKQKAALYQKWKDLGIIDN